MRYFIGALTVCLGGAAFGQSASDLCANAPTISSFPGSANFDLQGAGPTFGLISCGLAGDSGDQWVRVSNTSGQCLDITADTCGSADFDSVLTVYSACGDLNAIACNDDGCDQQSSVTFLLPAGRSVLVRVARFDGPPSTNGSGTIHITAAPASTGSPLGASASLVNGVPGLASVLWVGVTPGLCPQSSGVTVTADLTAVGGTQAEPFFDDGTNGDQIAGDGIYSRLFPLPSTTAEGVYQLPVSVQDAQLRTASATLQLAVDSVGDLPITASIPRGTGPLTSIGGRIGPSDADMYRIEICTPAQFTAVTNAPYDTQLWLFKLDGRGAAHNDNGVGLQARLTNVGNLQPGDYFLAVTRFNRDAVDVSGRLIWNDLSAGAARVPDGPGAANPIAAWVNLTNATANPDYSIILTGVCHSSLGNPCVIADLNSDGVVDFNDYLEFLNLFNASDPRVDFNLDGVVDFNDYLEFLNLFNSCQ